MKSAQEVENVERNIEDFFFFGGLAMGYYSEDARVEFELINSRVKGDIKNREDISVYTGMINLYYDHYNQNTSFAPYAGVGIGFGIRLSEDTTTMMYGIPFPLPILSYQGKLGISYNFTPQIGVSVGYRLFYGFAAPGEIFRNNIGVGFSYAF
ncbi:P44/Msp2 family outer membrane protein [Wolbachia endosymbiont of Folsomia candida]|uniref:P44/Msp2 family outer membrane protein n=1 Tax=Wolbachia endosymbiont of Folsomia candida TaxID=169402 RepID=UPI001300BC95|nr:P44/Msp2 family outer membrane protein [Wolbachia endosymbiont of Folsomia candida]